MIKVTFLYPNTDGSKFDLDYYLNQHLDLSRSRFGSALKGVSVEQGIGGIVPGSPPPFHAIGTLSFDSVEEFYKALEPHLEELRSDVANYATVEPVIQISDAKL